MRLRTTVAVMALLLASSALADGVAATAGIDSQRRQVSELVRQLDDLDARAGAAAAAHNDALDERDAVARRIGETRAEAARASRRLTTSRRILDRRLVDLYVHGEPDLFEALLQSGDLGDFLAITDLVERTAERDATVVERVRQRRHDLERLRLGLAKDAVVAREQLVEATRQKQRVEDLVDARRRALDEARADLGASLAAERQRLAHLAAQKRAVRAAPTRSLVPSPATAASAVIEPGPTGALPGGSHVYPLAGPSTFGDDWLASRPGGRYHEGIDLFASRGTPVVAVADGTLFRVGYSGISGYRFWLRDSAGTEFFYAHLDGYSPAAREGATVTKGTVLGYNGDSGDAKGTSPHVHFEIHPGGGGPIRPYPIVSGWPRI